jgi:hypothetical protein
MSLSDLAWLAIAAYAVHVLEEYTLDWRNWARAVIKLPVEWNDFYVTNMVVIILGIVQAQLATTLPLAPLSYAAVMLINATFFHVGPFAITKGRFSPGLITAVFLFYPIGLGCYWQAASLGLLTAKTLLTSIFAGGILMAFPIVLLRLKSKPYFNQSDV